MILVETVLSYLHEKRINTSFTFLYKMSFILSKLKHHNFLLLIHNNESDTKVCARVYLQGCKGDIATVCICSMVRFTIYLLRGLILKEIGRAEHEYTNICYTSELTF